MVEGIFRNMGLKVVEKAVEMLKKREEAIASNIANADTPFFKSRKVEFERSLREALYGDSLKLVTTDRRHIPNGVDLDEVEPTYRLKVYPGRNDLNTVNIDEEMADYAKTHLKYNALLSGYSFTLGMLKYVIGGGRR